MKKILLVFGTRPEAIKIIPVLHALKKKSYFEVKTCVTAQHKEILYQVLDKFSVKVDFTFDIIREKSDLYYLTFKIMEAFHDLFKSYRPDFILVHGDTSTTFCSTLSSFYAKIPVGHIEAGLRSKNIYAPFPEEINRKLTSHIALFHFAPTQKAKKNLIKEGIKKNNIIVTGNTVIDMLFYTLNIIKEKKGMEKEIIQEIEESGYRFSNRKFVLITGHRRENFGEGFLNIATAIQRLCKKFDEIDFIYVLHPNPNVENIIRESLKNISNMYLIAPLSYTNFLYMMMRCHLIMSDSGGVQEEAPSLKKPVFVLREVTERPEALKTGMVKLVGTSIKKIESSVEKVLLSKKAYRKMTKGENPFGDGKASHKIVSFLKEKLYNNE